MNTAAQTPLSESTAQTGRSRRAGKAVLAGAVAVGLLAAGGGTFSKWSDSEAIASDATVATGELSLALAEGATWTDGNDKTIDINTYQVVPGDTVKLKVSPTIQAEGDTLKGTLALDLPANLESVLGTYVDYDLEVTGLSDGDGDGLYQVTEANDGQTVDVTAAFTWKADSVKDQEGQNVPAQSLKGFNLVLDQSI
ncbi:alternate-type signal peptide domain-containing protein [Kocuria rosea]|uniref:Alternate-type signal peptide domain-containing protein n=1 Tax=Kocuria rosea TaxID=1275 RepID=A0A4R5Y3H3_KOCRO|nr:alternate-type signal peptide domain-containing protein [Kocuria rosea]TDL39031.1 alternate-type signal peptide domain-containing protein [Kocuria rosea]